MDWQKAYYVLHVAHMSNNYGAVLDWLRDDAIEELKSMRENRKETKKEPTPGPTVAQSQRRA